MTENKTTLADLNQLMDFGFVTEPCSIKTDNGEFRFELKSITPLEEVHAQKEVSARSGADETAKNIHTAIEFLARTIVSVNGVPLQDHPSAQGKDPLERKRYVVSKFSEKLMLPLWNAYKSMKAKVNGIDEESDDLKKS